MNSLSLLSSPSVIIVPMERSPRFRLYAPGRRLLLHDMNERRQLTGVAGMASVVAAGLLVLYRVAQRSWPAVFTGTGSDRFWLSAVSHLIGLCLIPFVAAGFIQIARKPSARFVLGANKKWSPIVLSALIGVAMQLTWSGLSVFALQATRRTTVQTMPAFFTDGFVPLHSALPVHLLVFVLGVLLTGGILVLFTFGYVAPGLDIGWHRARAVLGTALLFALFFGDRALFPTMFLTGIMLTIIRLNTDSLYATLAALISYFAVGAFKDIIFDQLALLFFGQTGLDAGHTYSLALIVMLSGAALFVPSIVFLSGMWRDQHLERMREAIAKAGDKALPSEPDRPFDFLYLIACLLLVAVLFV